MKATFLLWTLVGKILVVRVLTLLTRQWAKGTDLLPMLVKIVLDYVSRCNASIYIDCCSAMDAAATTHPNKSNSLLGKGESLYTLLLIIRCLQFFFGSEICFQFAKLLKRSADPTV